VRADQKMLPDTEPCAAKHLSLGELLSNDGAPSNLERRARTSPPGHGWKPEAEQVLYVLRG